MSNYEEPTNAELEGLLSTYAEALYQSSIIPDGDNGDDQTPDGIAVTNTNQKERIVSGNSQEQPAVEVDLEPVDQTTSKGRILALVGGLLLVAAVGVGAVSLLTDNDASELDVAQTTEEEAVEEASAEAADPTSEAADNATDTVQEEVMVDEFASEIAIADSSFFSPFGQGQTVFVNGDFATLQSGTDGFEVTFGLENGDATPVTGLPDGEAFPSLVIATDTGFAALIEQWDIVDAAAAEEFDFFGPGEEPTRFIATSTDMINWTSAQLPSIDIDGGYTWFSSIAASGDQIVIAGQADNSGTSPEQILLEAGAISEEDMFNICNSSYGPDSFEMSTCDFDSYDESSTEQPEETLLISIERGDELFPLIEEALNASNDEPELLMITGSIDGGLEVVDAPVEGWNIQVSGTSAGFIVAGSGELGSAVFSSTNGITWTEVETPGSASAWGISSLMSSGNTVLAVTQEFDGIGTWVTTDLGASWAESAINTELFSPWGQAVAGPAGFAIELQGATEPYETGFPEDQEEVSLERDGYTMIIDWFSTGGASLIGPDGAIVYDNIVLTGQDVDGVTRFEGSNDETVVWIDPDTGEDLVSFGEADFEAAFPEPEFDENFVEPDIANETWFSADGVTWNLLSSQKSDYESYSGVLAVGDDEIVIFNEAFVEPPQELYNFEGSDEPSEEEIAALDAWYAEQGNNTTYEVIPVS